MTGRNGQRTVGTNKTNTHVYKTHENPKRALVTDGSLGRTLSGGSSHPLLNVKIRTEPPLMGGMAAGGREACVI